MDKVNQYAFYELGAALRVFHNLKEGERFNSYLIECLQAMMKLSRFVGDNAHIPMRLSKNTANALRHAIQEMAGFTEGKEVDLEKAISRDEVNTITRRLGEFETVFSMEAQNLDVYAVTQKAGYSTDTLIQRGEEVIPQPIREYMPQYALDELHEAGRCLVFTLPTAAGFHMMRALESVLHSYWDAISGGKPRPTYNNGQDVAMGGYIAEVEKAGADTKVIAVLRQIKDLHRNPLMHPDAVLTMTDAIILLGVVTSATAAMVEGIKKATAPPSSPPALP